MTNELFKEPFQFGLRGDPYLWKDLKKKFESSDISTIEEFKYFLLNTFKEHTGSLPVKGKNFTVEHFSFGGMSSGMICSDFWIEKGFPLLEERFKELHK